MTNKQQKEWYEEYVKRARVNLGITEKDYADFKRVGKALNKCFVKDVNGFYREEDRLTNDRITASYYKTADKMAKELGLYIYYQTDPRGATIYLSRHEIPENNYTVATCIY